MIRCLLVKDEKNALDALHSVIDNPELILRDIKLSDGEALKLLDKLVHSVKVMGLEDEKIALPIFHGYQFEKINSILYCEADQNYTRIYTIKGNNYMISKALGYVEKLLPSNIFFKIHKSVIVNINYITSYSRENGYKVKLENGTELDVATRRNDEFLKVILKK